MERFHRTLKAAIMCHPDQQWTEALPLVLLVIHVIEDLQASVAELVYGEPLRIPGELLNLTANPLDPVHLVTELRKHMARLRAVLAACHNSPDSDLFVNRNEDKSIQQTKSLNVYLCLDNE
jgi:cleavage and polyadenylation specificity factor subunit 1